MKRILIVGCGDIALRVAPLLRSRYRLFGLVRNPARFEALRSVGMVPLWGDLDEPRSLRQLHGLAHTVLHLAPPPGEGAHDTRTRHLLAALAHPRSEFARCRPQRLVYVSTSGVYGDCHGAMVSETRPAH
ncbi:MAG TPA: SDR family NAD(P)-dependent oxidoreductase, partial [Gallionellaceae bacterium]|nr:SDR family NAD(P)-dependent oxidoreductase [Gallionellaceae bacterium]